MRGLFLSVKPHLTLALPSHRMGAEREGRRDANDSTTAYPDFRNWMG
jgi:hypothetical protein